MLSPVLCIKLKNYLVPKGREIFTYAQSYRLGTPSASLNVKAKVLLASNQTHAIIRRQILVKASQKRSQTTSPEYSWDRVSPDFTVVYTNSLKNWIWGYYVAQIVAGALGTWFCWYEFVKHVDDIPAGTTEVLIACFTVMFSVIIGANFWFRRVPIRIYHNDEKNLFVAVRRTCFGRLKKLYYTPADVAVAKKSEDGIDVGAKVRIKGQQFYLVSANFVLPTYYNKHVQGDRFVDIQEAYARGPKF